MRIAPRAFTFLCAVMISGVPAIGMAQASKAAKAKMAQQKPAKKDMKEMEDMKAMQGMRGMTGGPHHVLVMAYRDNLATFAKALRWEVTRTDSVNPDVALPAVAEMKRSLEPDDPASSSADEDRG